MFNDNISNHFFLLFLSSLSQLSILKIPDDPRNAFLQKGQQDDIPIFLIIKKITIFENVAKKLTVVSMILCSSELNIKVIIRIAIWR